MRFPPAGIDSAPQRGIIPPRQPLAALPAALLAVLLPASTIPWGSVTPAGELGLRLAAFLLLGLAFSVPGAAAGGLRVVAPAGALAGLALLGLAQSLGWPARLVGWLASEHLRLARESAPPVADAGPEWLSLSLSPSSSRSVALTLASVAAILLVAAVVAARRRHRRWLAAALAAAALVQLVAGARRLLALQPDSVGTALAVPTNRLVGTYVNPNHLALLLEMVLLVCSAAVWVVGRRWRRLRPGQRLLALAAASLVTGAVFFALVLTRSRAGMLGAVAGLGVQALAAVLASRRRWRRALLAAGGAAAGGLAVIVGLRSHLGRLLETPLMEVTWAQRTQVWRETLEVWALFPLTGSGLGTFGEAFPLVQSPRLTLVAWVHAHNDWVEILATGGVVGAALVAAGLGGLLWRLRAVLRGARRSEDRAAVLAALGALAAVGVHEFFGFGLTVPANAAVLAAVCGAAAGVPVRAAAADGRSRGGSRRRPG